MLNLQNGKFYYLEHVAAPPRTWKRWLEDKLSPIWSEVADGCVLNKETGDIIKSVGFSDVVYQTTPNMIGCKIFKVDVIFGTATK